jgi:hypothetical protein
MKENYFAKSKTRLLIFLFSELLTQVLEIAKLISCAYFFLKETFLQFCIVTIVIIFSKALLILSKLETNGAINLKVLITLDLLISLVAIFFYCFIDDDGNIIDMNTITTKSVISYFFILYGFIGLKALSTYLLVHIKKEK